MRDDMNPSVNQAHSADTTGDNNWGLVPDALPHMEYAPTSAGEVVRVGAPAEEQPGLSTFPESPLTVRPGTSLHLLLDRKTLTTAYPILTVSGGKGAKIWLTYSEALYDKQMHKGDRDEVGNRQAHGLKDNFLPDGGQHRTFEPLWWRTWRYLDLDIETADTPLTLESLTAAFTAYPFEERATFISPDNDLKQIWDISWRTARLDAHETYMDTPYYEQLQYVGDTRIQALISYAVAGDDRLAKQALEAFDASRFPTGLHAAATRVRWPKPSRPSLCCGSRWCGTGGTIDPIRSRCALRCPVYGQCSTGLRATNSRTDCCGSCRGGALSIGYRRARFPRTTRTESRA
jgi:hypothetical protein